jgi:hypothetical protein
MFILTSHYFRKTENNMQRKGSAGCQSVAAGSQDPIKPFRTRCRLPSNYTYFIFLYSLHIAKSPTCVRHTTPSSGADIKEIYDTDILNLLLFICVNFKISI